MPQPERVTDGDGKITHAEFVGVGDGNLCQVARVLDLQQGDIALIVATNQLGVKLATVVELDTDLLCLINNVVIG
ncbi:hypothetical protein D3C73_1243360 [compost metagenome]